MEIFQQLGDRIGALWAYFQNDAGELSIYGALLLAALSLATAIRCVRVIQPAFGDKELTSAVGVGGAIAAVFGTIGLYFLYVAVAA